MVIVYVALRSCSLRSFSFVLDDPCRLAWMLGHNAVKGLGLSQCH